MVILAWSENIHEPQEGEVDREWCYLQPFFIFPGNLREYVDFLEYAFNKIVSSNCHQTVSKYEKILQDTYKGVFEFDAHDIKNGKPPKYIIYQWSNGRNCKADVKYTWKERKSSFRKELFSDRKEDVKLIVAEAIIELTKDTIYLAKENKKVVKKEVINGTYTPGKSEAATKANKNVADTLIQYIEDDVTKIKAEVEAAVEANANIETTSEVNIDYEKLHERDKALMQELMGVDNDNNSSSSE